MNSIEAFVWLREKFPNLHPLGGVVGIFDYFGYRLMKNLPPEWVEFSLDNETPVRSKAIQKDYKRDEEVSIVRFNEWGVYVQAFGVEEVGIPFSAFRGFKLTSDKPKP